MDVRRVGGILLVGVTMGAAAFSTVQARQAADRAALRSITIVVPVTDINRSVEFYRTVLEFESANLLPTVGGDQVVLTVGGQYVALRQSLKERPHPEGIRLIVHVVNPGEYAARLRARGAVVNVEVTGLDRQPAAFTVVDPDGYLLYFIGAR